MIGLIVGIVLAFASAGHHQTNSVRHAGEAAAHAIRVEIGG